MFFLFSKTGSSYSQSVNKGLNKHVSIMMKMDGMMIHTVNVTQITQKKIWANWSFIIAIEEQLKGRRVILKFLKNGRSGNSPDMLNSSCWVTRLNAPNLFSFFDILKKKHFWKTELKNLRLETKFLCMRRHTAKKDYYYIRLPKHYFKHHNVLLKKI